MFITIDGIKLHYEIYGEGETLLLLHGWGAQIASWGPVIPSLSKNRRVVALDFPGFGQSDEPPQPWSVTEYMELTQSFIETLALGKVDILAHSFGGRVTILLSALNPKTVGKLILTDSAGLIPKRGPGYYAKVYSYKLLKKLAQSHAAAKALSVVGVDVKERMAKRAGSEDYRALNARMRATFVKVVNQDLRPYLKQIRSPALLIWGENDTDTPVAFGKIMEKEIPDAGLVILKNAGHYSYLDQFVSFDKIVKHFLDI